MSSLWITRWKICIILDPHHLDIVLFGKDKYEVEQYFLNILIQVFEVKLCSRGHALFKVLSVT